jgi:hypothetical protein
VKWLIGQAEHIANAITGKPVSLYAILRWSKCSH